MTILCFFLLARAILLLSTTDPFLTSLLDWGMMKFVLAELGADPLKCSATTVLQGALGVSWTPAVIADATSKQVTS